MNNIRESIRQINIGLSQEKSQKIITFLTMDNSLVQSTVIANLSIMYGQAEERTIIIDTDFASDNFASAFGVTVKEGLSDYLNDKNINIGQIVNDIPGQTLSLITSGALPNDETKYLLGDPRFNNLIKQLSVKYDRILINTSVFTNYASIKNVLELTDGVILTVGLYTTQKRRAEALIGMLKKNRINILGYINTKR